MAKMTGFIFQDEYLERLAKLSDQELGRLVRALAIYHATGEQQELAGRESIAYDFIKVDIDRIDEKYAAKCDTNRNNRQRPSTTVNDRQQSSTIVPKDKVKDKEEDINNNNNSACETECGIVQIDPVRVYIQQNLNELTPTHYEELDQYEEILPGDLIKHAVDESVGNGVRNWTYVRAILRNYVQNNIRTVGEAKAWNDQRRKGKGKSEKPAVIDWEKENAEFTAMGWGEIS